MLPNPMQELLARVEKLESQNRLLKRVGLVLGLVLGTGLLMAAAQDKPPKKTVDANRLSFKDDDGVECGYMTATADGLGLVFTGGGGPASGLVVNKDGVLLQLLDNTGKPLSGLTVNNNGIGMGFRSSKVGNDVGSNAIRDVLGNSLQPSPFLAKPERKP